MTPVQDRPTLRRNREDRGAVMVLAVFAIIALIAAAGLAIDIGRQRTERRDAQANADVIALDMARLADGASLTAIQTIPFDYNGVAADHLRASASRNQIPFTDPQKGHGVNTGGIELWDGSTLRLTVQWGWFSEQNEDSDCGAASEQVQVDNGWWVPCTGGNKDIPNAAMVTTYSDVDFLLLPAGGGPSGGSVTRTAIARHGSNDLVSFRIGSYLLDGVDEGLLDNLFTDLLGTSVDLQALHYDGLLRHELTIADIAEFNGITGSPEQVLSQQITFDQLAEATIDSLRSDGNGDLTEAQISAIEAVFASATLIASEPIVLGDLLAADPTDPNSALTGQVSALDFLQTGAHLSQCKPNGATNSDGDPLYDCHGVVADDLVADVGGVVVVGAPETTVTEGPRVYVGDGGDYPDSGDSLETSQVSTTVALDITSSPGEDRVNCGLLGLNCILSGLLGDLLGELDRIAVIDATGEISIDLVGGRAKVLDLCHNSPDSRDLLLGTTTSLYDVEARIDIQFENRIYGLLGLQSATPFTISLIVSNSPPNNTQNLTFTDPGTMGPETLGGGSIGLNGLDVDVELDGNPIGIEDLDPLFDLLVNNLVEPTVDNLTALLTNGLVPNVDALVGELSDRLGINLTGADLEGRYVRCGDFGVQLVG